MAWLVIHECRPYADLLARAAFSPVFARADAVFAGAFLAVAFFAAPDFNRKAFDQALERMRVADTALETEEMKVVSESVATLTPDERRAAAEWAMAHRGFGMHHGGGRGF